MPRTPVTSVELRWSSADDFNTRFAEIADTLRAGLRLEITEVRVMGGQTNTRSIRFDHTERTVVPSDRTTYEHLRAFEGNCAEAVTVLENEIAARAAATNCHPRMNRWHILQNKRPVCVLMGWAFVANPYIASRR